MQIKTIYDKTDGIETSWYNSSTIVYSEFNDKLFELVIVFKKGRTYKYKDVNTFDYIQFRNGIGTDASQGLSFNKFIKKYDFERLDDTNLVDLENKLAKIIADEEKELNEYVVTKTDFVKKRIAFDFDGTLTNSMIQDLVKNLTNVGHEIFLITKRCEEFDGYMKIKDTYPAHIEQTEENYNSDLFDVAKSLGIQKENVYFTCGESKVKLFRELKIDLIFDDEHDNVEDLNSNGCLAIKIIR